MLLGLKVSNFGIIEQINWHPSQGLNVITGETGAGKSLVIDAVETLLSGRGDDDVIRYGADEAFLEVIFDITAQDVSPKLSELLNKNGLVESGEHQLVISGEIRRNSRSLFRVNGKAVSRGLLKGIGNLLVDIHGQSEHLSLLNTDFQLDFLDAYAHTVELRSYFSSKANRLLQIEQELKAISEQEKERARQEEFLRFQIAELRHADLREGEEEVLEKERTLLAASERLKEASYEAYRAIYGDDSSMSGTSVLEKLNDALRAVQKLTELDDSLQSQSEYIQGVESGLTDVARDIRNYHDRIAYEPQRLQELELRLELIRDLKRKYGQSIAEILQYLEDAEEKLSAIGTSEERQRQQEEEKRSLKVEMGALASQLSQKRADAAKKLMAEVNNQVKELNMPQVKFEVYMTRDNSEEGIPFPDGELYAFTQDGADVVEFRVSTNPGEPLKPLAIIASTGEISRFMLALKSALAEADNIPVLIFDEIDIGVGGRSGEIVGKKLWDLSCHRQAICITHLPQIAVFADSQYKVRKTTTGNRTTSLIEKLQGDSQIEEIAIMLSGSSHTEIAISNAEELLERATVLKNAKSPPG